MHCIDLQKVSEGFYVLERSKNAIKSLALIILKGFWWTVQFYNTRTVTEYF